MILGDVEETVTTVEIDEETYEEIYKVFPCLFPDEKILKSSFLHFLYLDIYSKLHCRFHLHLVEVWHLISGRHFRAC